MIAWSLLPILALADMNDWQVGQGLVLIGIVLSTSSRAYTTAAIHSAAAVPLATVSAVAFVRTGEGAASMLAIAFALALMFTLSAGTSFRESRIQLAASARCNQVLAERLREDNDELCVAYRELDKRAGTDPLTGPLNRVAFRDRLAGLLRDPDEFPISLCFIDLDNFKTVNDSYGHAKGDEILQAVSDRLTGAALPEKFVGRHGGDEFVVVSTGQAAAELIALGERLIDAFSPPFHIDGHEFNLTVSIGIDIAGTTSSVETLMHTADKALYSAKQFEQSHYVIYNHHTRDTPRRQTPQRR